MATTGARVSKDGAADNRNHGCDVDGCNRQVGLAIGPAGIATSGRETAGDLVGESLVADPDYETTVIPEAYEMEVQH